jgi:hypothetical protein
MPLRVICLSVSVKIVTQYIILNILITYLEGTTDVATPSEGFKNYVLKKRHLGIGELN